MKGRKAFTTTEVEQLRQMIREKNRSTRGRQKAIRHGMRMLGFYITDFGYAGTTFTEEDLEDLLRSGRIGISNP